ncbi:uncharacterized protein LOC115631851 [Scaptodrosophila lebanonensis]|uniref:Uncharacterized protein LOC115631851 n=1 Tax=Drosophila lebanonensis TaxID=7225 RepID=A0A6J2U983_DROLE|nr:uncharacterized protein LOC115631851 [Scaptodrosophila lebanonensis]
MSFALMRKLLLLPIKRVCVGAENRQNVGGGPLKIQVRHHWPIAGPPRWPMSTGQRFIMGWGSLIIMMIIPFWALFQVPRWSALHNNLPYGEEEKDNEEEVDNKEK